MTYSNRDSGRNIGALILIGLGVLFLLGQVFHFDIGDVFSVGWPFIMILPGAVMLAVAFSGGRSAAGLAIPGMVLSGIGAIFLVQQAFNYYESWAYVWTLIPGFVGIGMLFMGLRRADRRQFEVGQRMIRGALLGFIVFGGFFEVLIFEHFGSLGHLVLPVLLIGGGIFLLTNRRSIMGGTSESRTRRHGRRRSWGSWDADEKSKNDGMTGEKEKIVDPRSPSDLYRRIDEAIREDDPTEPTTYV